jgi:hypothetical protein
MMAGRGKLKPTTKGKSHVQETTPVRSPLDDGKRSEMLNLSPSLSNRRSSGADLLPGLPDRAPRKSKGKSPLAKDPATKDGTIEVPGLGSLIERIVDERHQSNHFGDRPIKEHLELPSEENDKSNESSSIQTGDKSLKATDLSIGSSSSQEGNRSLNDKETEAWLSNISIFEEKKKDTSGAFEESNHGREKWGDLSTKIRAPKALKSLIIASISMLVEVTKGCGEREGRELAN